MATPTHRHRSDPPHGRLPRVTVEITRGRVRERFRDVDVSAYLIGAADDCDLVLADPRFPDVHAYIIRRHDGVSLRYLGNKPALTVNNRLVRNTPLADGDQIASGPYELTVHIGLPGSPATLPGPSFLRLSTDRRRPASAGPTGSGEADAQRLIATIRAVLDDDAVPTQVLLQLGANVAV